MPCLCIGKIISMVLNVLLCLLERVTAALAKAFQSLERVTAAKSRRSQLSQHRFQRSGMPRTTLALNLVISARSCSFLFSSQRCSYKRLLRLHASDALTRNAAGIYLHRVDDTSSLLESPQKTSEGSHWRVAEV